MLTKLTLTIYVSLLALLATAGAGNAKPRLGQTGAQALSRGLEINELNPATNSYPALVVAPIARSGHRSLVADGDTLYLVDHKKHIQWRHSTGGNSILDMSVDRRGFIYLGIFDGRMEILNPRGRRVWSHFMNGSANYAQIKPYRNGFLVVVDMEGYREKQSAVEGSTNIHDLLENWQSHQKVWQKEFPAGAKLRISGDRVLAIVPTKDGPEITEIR